MPDHLMIRAVEIEPSQGPDCARYRNIQVLRGIACLFVVLYHTSADESRFGMPFQPLHFVQWFGYAGVDLFFVISGFIIASSNRVNLGRPGRLPKYLVRRLWRIYPTYWAALAIVTGLWAVIAPHLFESITAREIVETVALLPQQPMPRLIPAAWSLSYELMFYLVFASLFLLPRRFAGGVLLIWGVVVLSVPLIGYKPANRFAALSFNPYVLEFLAGAAVAWRPLRLSGRTALAAVAVAGAWCPLAFLALNPADPIVVAGDLSLRALVFGPAFLLVVLAAAGWERGGGRLRLGPLAALGDASYSVYLAHSSALPAAFYLTIAVKWPHSPVGHSAWLVVMLAAGIGSGLLMHRVIERPLLKAGRNPNLSGWGKSLGQFAGRLAGRNPRITSFLSPGPRTP
jgi:exopolysaccharide production protein ExoZ